ncbi:MAG TPA: DUF1840 domain-containing protein [Aquabacterium sp.]|uniref:DUF1840 domain-containing protein n=1 Tax=Aquabacterium sp. TaxID=1872578 RepID=UPI002E356FCC|nr:DUF1840 domain-containing protein [Aquabacterium sp.]HEX5356276.1 DUF1840 domain-containing protein [Aquabacterium sp.]
MLVKLRSAATGDLLLTGDLAKALAKVLDKRFDAPGILEPQSMPVALEVLKALPDESPTAGASADGGGDAAPREEPASVSFQDEAVSLRKRAWPLIKMIEEALAADKPIVWGV